MSISLSVPRRQGDTFVERGHNGMVHNAAQEKDATGGHRCNVKLLLFFIAHTLVKDTKLSSIALLPIWVKVYNCLQTKTVIQKTR